MITVWFSLDSEFALFLSIPTVLGSGQLGGKQNFLHIDLKSAKLLVPSFQVWQGMYRTWQGNGR